MAQLVARLNGIQKARGSNPLVSTTKISYICTIFFYVGIGDSHDFIVVLLCNTNPYGLTLTLLRKRPRYTSYESPCLHHENIVHLYDIFYTKTFSSLHLSIIKSPDNRQNSFFIGLVNFNSRAF